VDDAPNSRTRDDEFLGALDDKFDDLRKSITSNDDDRRIDGVKRTFDTRDHVYPRDHVPTDAPTELQQRVTPFAKAVSAAEGFNRRRLTHGEDRHRKVTHHQVTNDVAATGDAATHPNTLAKDNNDEKIKVAITVVMTIATNEEATKRRNRGGNQNRVLLRVLLTMTMVMTEAMGVIPLMDTDDATVIRKTT
jgi:hypothetical protein